MLLTKALGVFLFAILFVLGQGIQLKNKQRIVLDLCYILVLLCMIVIASECKKSSGPIASDPLKRV